jgi:N-acetylgalactosamine 4-sulfate 6-O-sulfotransferase
VAVPDRANVGAGNITIAEVIAEVNPAARLMLSLRDPVQRLWSDFFYFAHRPNHERSVPLPHPDTEVTAEHFDAFATEAVRQFTACTEAAGGGQGSLKRCTFATRTFKKYHAGQVRLAMGCYGPFVEEYLAHFPQSQLLVLTLEQYKDDPKATLRRAFDHLGAREPSEGEWASILARNKITNQQGDHYKKLTMMASTQTMLRQFYAQCNADLAEKLGDTRFLGWAKGQPVL